jgi:hypothetical protein
MSIVRWSMWSSVLKQSLLLGMAMLVISPGLNINCPQLISFIWKIFFAEKQNAKGQKMKDEVGLGVHLKHHYDVRFSGITGCVLFGSFRGFMWMCDQETPCCQLLVQGIRVFFEL